MGGPIGGPNGGPSGGPNGGLGKPFLADAVPTKRRIKKAFMSLLSQVSYTSDVKCYFDQFIYTFLGSQGLLSFIHPKDMTLGFGITRISYLSINPMYT